jgi:tetratricopeptide (TPR) repeat protein
MYGQAEAQFVKALSDRDYLPALVNLGNIFYVKGDIESALTYFERAIKMSSANESALVGLIRSYDASGDRPAAKKAYEELRTINPDLATEFAYLSSADSSTRAKEAGRLQGILWDQEDK